MMLKKFSFIFTMVAGLVLASGCISDPGVNKNRGKVTDFSLVNSVVGCGKNLLILSQPDTCTTSCSTGTHKASATELTQAKTDNADNTSLLSKNHRLSWTLH